MVLLTWNKGDFTEVMLYAGPARIHRNFTGGHWMQREQHAPRCGGLTMVHLNCEPLLSEHGGWRRWDWETHIRGPCYSDSASRKPTLVALWSKRQETGWV